MLENALPSTVEPLLKAVSDSPVDFKKGGLGVRGTRGPFGALCA
ncbi:hypothetical protein ACFW9X_12845 [Streptomyces sp. NPDC059466]